MKDNEDFESPTSRSRDRQTTFGYNSSDLHQIDKILHEFKVVHEVSLPSFMGMMETYPFMREETKLIEQVFKHSELVQDMLAFLLEPHRMLNKYQLNTKDALRYIKNIAHFTRDNLEFYQFLFIALEENSKIMETNEEADLRRQIIDPKQICLDQWFYFLEDKTITKDEQRTALGYISEIFIPFVKYEFSSSSRISDYYEARYKKDTPICLIFHLHAGLLHRLIKFTHFEPILKFLFKLVLVSLQQQEWKHSLCLLDKLCESAVVTAPPGSQRIITVGQQTSDLHIENIYNMVKQVSDNITNDRNRTVFAFIAAIIKAQVVKGAINRLRRFYEQRQDFTPLDKWDREWIIELNLKTLAEIVKIYYLLLKSKINRNATLMNQLRNVVLLITRSVGELITLIKSVKVDDINFSNGQTFKATPFFKYQFLNLIRYLLLVQQDHGQFDLEMKLDQYYPEIIALMQLSLSQNRWNSINHSMIQKIVGMIITTEFFKTKDAHLNNFLEFLMEAFTNKKYVFLNSTRMTTQGDIQSLYNICRKIAISFEKASLGFGLSNQYEQWRGFVLSVLQGYEKTIESRTSSIQSDTDFLGDHHESNQAFTVEIDEIATVKQIVQRIETKQIWMNKCSSSKNLFRSGSEENLLDLPKTCKTIQNFKREVEFSPNATPKPRVSFHQEKVARSLISEFQTGRKLSSSAGHIQQQSPDLQKEEEYFRLSKILSIGKHTSEIVDERESKKSQQESKEATLERSRQSQLDKSKDSHK